MNAITTITTVITRLPINVATPPGAAWAAAAWMGVSRIGMQFLAWLRRGVEPAAATRRVSDANRLRRVASGFMSSDPRFAADLYAAADRHDRAE